MGTDQRGPTVMARNSWRMTAEWARTVCLASMLITPGQRHSLAQLAQHWPELRDLVGLETD
jgi:hypothetical protein